eukprot:3295351-Rhodomonas_salina.1
MAEVERMVADARGRCGWEQECPVPVRAAGSLPSHSPLPVWSAGLCRVLLGAARCLVSLSLFVSLSLCLSH